MLLLHGAHTASSGGSTAGAFAVLVVVDTKGLPAGHMTRSILCRSHGCLSRKTAGSCLCQWLLLLCTLQEQYAHTAELQNLYYVLHRVS